MNLKSEAFLRSKALSKLLLVMIIVVFVSCKEDETPSPLITSFSPERGMPGTTVTVTGENFGGSASDATVTLGGVPVDVTNVTSTTFDFTVAQDAVTGKIAISVAGKSVTSATDFEVFRTPTVQSFSPDRGEPGTEVTITGTNFSDVASENSVEFAGVSANIISSTTTSIVVEVPTATITGAITVTTNSLTATSTTNFVIPPTVSSIEPMTGTTGSEVEITGTAFSPNVSDNSVSFNGVQAVINEVSMTSMTVVVPEAASTGKITIEVLGEIVESEDNYIVAPNIISFSPIEGPVGTEVTISGSGFSSTEAENTVEFNGVAAVVTQATVNKLIVKVPEGASTGDLSVRVGDITSSGDEFEVIIEALGFGSDGYDVGYAIGVDADGNYYVGGSFQNQITLGGTSLVASGSEEAFIAKFDATSELQWIKRIGGGLNDRLYDLAVSETGDIVLSVDVSSRATYDNIALNNLNRGIAIIKLASDGSIIWSEVGESAQGVSNIDFDSDGDIVVTGSYNGVLEFGAVSVTSTGDDESYVAKLDGGNGDGIWIKGMSCTSSASGLGVATDSEGNVFFSGVFQETLNFNSTTLTSAGGVDSYFGKLDSNGNLIWLKQIAGAGWNYAYALETDASGDVVVTGSFDGSTDFGGESVSSIRLEDFYVAKYASADGSLSWVSTGGSTNGDQAKDISIGNNGDIYVVGYITGTTTLNGTTLETFGNSRDVFVTKLNSSGSFLEAHSGGAGESDSGYAIAIDLNGIMHITGYYRNLNATFGITEVENIAGDDVFVWKIKPSN